MISEKLTEIRKSKGYTMKSVAEAIEMKPDTYRNYESGRLEPNLKTLQKLADFYGVSTDYLLGRTPVAQMATEQPEPLAGVDVSDVEKRIIMKYTSLDESARAVCMDVFRQMSKITTREESPENTNTLDENVE